MRIERALLAAGLCGVGIWVWSLLRTDLSQRSADRTFEQDLHAPRPQIPPAPGAAPVIPPGGIVGRLSIPRLGLRAMVREGSDADTLNVAVGHIPGTALPGGPGNFAVAGHRDTLFRGLRGIRRGDRIELETQGGKFSYIVAGTRIVEPDAVEVLKAGASPEMTLVTCFPFDYVGSAPHRFIVKASLVSGAEPPPPAPLVASQPPVQPPAAEPPRVKPRPQPTLRRVSFRFGGKGSRELTQGISIGVERIDGKHGRVSGWMWLAPERRTIWLKKAAVREPVVFYARASGKRRELILTSVTENSVSGYLALY